MLLPFTLLALLSQAGVDSTGLMARGVSRELAIRRAAEIRNVRYALDLDLSRADTASGDVRITFTLRRPGDVIVDFRGPALASVTVNNAAPLGRVEWNGKHLRIPGRLLKSGVNVVAARFSTLIAPAGAPIIRFHDETDRRDYLYTLLVPSDAHALFPCFD
jgi:aminopeptidase N